ncbi:hypothetical protein FG064_16540 [Vibrio cholerae]|uniref:hypothetical protein n=1 Tax=Vibrio cholerae TaxID=666 RepID=UPI0011D3B5F1|nr:hypothetical protein [Vibrio cholerae]EGR0468606.1 hypothetical protein [Vibrio cholerae]TXY52015.1 hypothetical protein FXE74_18660 [Vibrio cholerae]GIB34699.1 hypothetical protein VCSRO91_3578 [Vibrio cholerae]
MKKFTEQEMADCTKAYDLGFEASKNQFDQKTNPYERFSLEASCWREGFSDCETLKIRIRPI